MPTEELLPDTDQPNTDAQAAPNHEAEMKKLRDEAAKWRTSYRAEQEKVKQLTPAAEQLAALEEAKKSDVDKLREQMLKLEAQATAATQAAEMADKRVKLLKVATKANISPELADLLDLSKLDLEDEAGTLEMLKKLAPQQTANGGGASNPANAANGVLSPAEWYAKRGAKTTIFGG